MKIHSALDFWARNDPDRPAVAVGDTLVRSYSQLHLNTIGLAIALRGPDYKLRTGDRVVIQISNSVEFFESLYACWQAGLVAVPVNTRLHPRELRFIVKQCGASLCFSSSDLIGRFIEVGVPVVDVSSAEYLQALAQGRRQASDRSLDLQAPGPHDIAWIFYTSGTTGKPKGAMLSFRNLEAMCQCYFRDVDNQSPWTHILHPAPLSHGSGLYSLAHFLKGSCQVLPESGGFDAAEVFKLIEHWQHAVFFAAPTMIRRLTAYPGDATTANLKAVLFGGAPMYFEDVLAYIDRFGPKLAQLYGQGESPMTITAYPQSLVANHTHPRWQQRVASAGTAQSIVNVVCVDEHGFRVEPGELGEVIVKGESVMQGYWDNQAGSAEALRDGWLYTGDIGSFDKDGYLTLKDRSKDLVISGGNNVYPREVEELLLKHRDVDEVSVIGKPDREWGELIVAYIVSPVFKEAASSMAAVEHAQLESNLASALDAHCLTGLARFKRPRLYRFVDSLPKNNYGKVLKTRLREEETKYID